MLMPRKIYYVADGSKENKEIAFLFQDLNEFKVFGSASAQHAVTTENFTVVLYPV